MTGLTGNWCIATNPPSPPPPARLCYEADTHCSGTAGHRPAWEQVSSRVCDSAGLVDQNGGGVKQQEREAISRRLFSYLTPEILPDLCRKLFGCVLFQLEVRRTSASATHLLNKRPNHLERTLIFICRKMLNNLTQNTTRLSFFNSYPKADSICTIVKSKTCHLSRAKLIEPR